MGVLMSELKAVSIRKRPCGKSAMVIEVCRSVLTVGAVSLVLVTGVTSVLGQNSPDGPPVAKDKTEASLQIRRRITNSVDGSPIPGARVSIARTERKFDGGDDPLDVWNMIQVQRIPTVECISDDDGYFDYETSATIEDHTEVIVSFSASHENYVPARSMIRLEYLRDHNPLSGSLLNIPLWPAKEVTGTVLTQDGNPAANMPIHGMTLLEGDAAAKNKRSKRVHDLTTDDHGNFQLPVASPGTGVFWIVPDQFAPLSVAVSSEDQDLGVMHLQSGIKVRGIVLDVTGAPITGIRVTARPMSPEAKGVMDFLTATRERIQNAWQRDVESDSDGRFILPPVRPEKYEISVADKVLSAENDIQFVTPASYPGVFVNQILDLTRDEQEIILKAVPSTDIGFRTVDSEGRPASGIRMNVFGRTSDDSPLGFGMMLRKGETPGLSVTRVAAEMNKSRWQFKINLPTVAAHLSFLPP
ncbi:MAG TPA: carboxypeptidase-like regulatory domain-containing protein [Planctomycetaceae bacterium]|nr:carboxypeptidase-like regulatory domain-containing protein [Planctomycetaceae bacterium]